MGNTNHGAVTSKTRTDLSGNEKILMYDPDLASGSRSIQAPLSALLNFLHNGPHLSCRSTASDSKFIILASAIAYPTSSFVHGQTIAWDLYTPSSGHGAMFYTSATGINNERLEISFPTVKNVLYSSCCVDETFATQCLTCGPTVGLNTLEIAAYIPKPMGVTLTGDGSGGWTQSPSGILDLGAYSGGGSAFNVNLAPIGGVGGVNYDAIGISYVGPNRYTINRAYSALGMYNAKFILIDAVGSPLSSNPTTSDRVVLTNIGNKAEQVPLKTYSAPSNSWLSGFVNFWIWGAFEAWMIVQRSSPTTATVFWQAYPSASSYIIKRDTNSDFSTATTIYTGTNLAYDDSSLVEDTTYYYKMIAVISSVETDITTFNYKA